MQCILLGGFQASLARQKLRVKDIFLHGCAKGFQRFRFKQLYVALPLFAYQILINLFFFYEICFRINPYSTFLPMLFSKLIYCIPIITFLIFIAIFAVREFFCACYWYLGGFGLRNAKKRKCSSRQKESSCCTKRHNSFKSARRCPLVYSSFAVSDYNCCRRSIFLRQLT